MSEQADDRDEPEADEPEDGQESINDPLTRRDVEAPRAEFKGRTPE